LAVAAVLEEEKRQGFQPRDVSGENRGYDIESRVPQSGNLRFIEVKGRVAGAPVVTLTRNELLTALNKPEAWFLAIVPLDGGKPKTPQYYKEPFKGGIEFATASVNVRISELAAAAVTE
jgi:hypothetical protein